MTFCNIQDSLVKDAICLWALACDMTCFSSDVTPRFNLYLGLISLDLLGLMLLDQGGIRFF